MMDYFDLAKDAVFSLTDGSFLFPVLTYGVALMSAGALVLTLIHLLTLGGKPSTRWAAVAVWLLVAVAAGGAQLIAGDDLRDALSLGLAEAEHAKVVQHKTLLMWAWAGPVAVVLVVLIAMVPKSAGVRTAGLLVAVALAAGASVYALTLVHAHQRTANMSYELTVDMQTDLPEAWRERMEQVRPSAAPGRAGGGGGDTEPGDQTAEAADDGDEPVQFFGLPID